MTHKELITELSNRLGWTQARTSSVLESAIEIIGNNLVESHTINVQGFGVFEARLKQERISVNPNTKLRFLVPPKITPAFRPGQSIKDKLKSM